MTNIFQVSHVLPTYCMTLEASEITAKFEKETSLAMLYEKNVW